MLKFRHIIALLAFSMLISVNIEAQRRVKLNRGLERHEILGVDQDSGFITSDASGKALWVSLDSTRSILGVDTLSVTGQNYFNADLIQTAPVITHAAKSVRVNGSGSGDWLYDALNSWEVDNIGGVNGSRISLRTVGADFLFDDAELELRQNQVVLQTDNSFFQVSDFGTFSSKIVFRAGQYRFSDGVGGQFPSAAGAGDSLMTITSEGYVGFKAVSSLPQAIGNSYSFSKVSTGDTWHDGKAIYKQSFDLGTGTGSNKPTSLTISSVDNIVKGEESKFNSVFPSWEVQGISVKQGATYYEVSTANSDTFIIITLWFTEP